MIAGGEKGSESAHQILNFGALLRGDLSLAWEWPRLNQPFPLYRLEHIGHARN